MAGRRSDEVAIREATDEDHVAASRVLDGALLDVSDLADRIADGTVLVATIDDDVIGAIVVAPDGPTSRAPPASWPEVTHVRAIAVRRKYRRAGIGSALVEDAGDRWGALLADFEADVQPFYESLGAECRETADGRRWALLRWR